MQLFETAQPAVKDALSPRSCSDCTEYHPQAEMLPTPAGNVICARCNKRRRNLQAERDQLSMFGQENLF